LRSRGGFLDKGVEKIDIKKALKEFGESEPRRLSPWFEM
jgi:hypothetical protein